MITNIIVGIACFLLGGVCSALYGANVVRTVNQLYIAETGNDFVSWVFDRSNDIRKAQVKGETLILNVKPKNED
jgi:hypothetical protein